MKLTAGFDDFSIMIVRSNDPNSWGYTIISRVFLLQIFTMYSGPHKSDNAPLEVTLLYQYKVWNYFEEQNHSFLPHKRKFTVLPNIHV